MDCALSFTVFGAATGGNAACLNTACTADGRLKLAATKVANALIIMYLIPLLMSPEVSSITLYVTH